MFFESAFEVDFFPKFTPSKSYIYFVGPFFYFCFYYFYSINFFSFLSLFCYNKFNFFYLEGSYMQNFYACSRNF